MSLRPSSSSLPSLPPEVILHIIESLIPNPKPIALPASHPITQTLLSLAQTSRLTYPTSMRLLYSYCIYIDSFTRLDVIEEALLRLGKRTLEISDPDAQFPDRDFHIPLLNYITSLYIGPFSEDQKHLDNIHQIKSICNILELVAPKLKRLVVSIRPQNPYAQFIEDEEFDPMRETFARMTSLEVFCSEEYAFWMSGTGDQDNLEDYVAWTKWPKLRVLALGRTDLTYSYQWGWLGKIQGLETLVLRYHNRYSLYNVDLNPFWREYQNDEAVEKKIEFVIVHEKKDRRYGKWTVLGEDGWIAGCSLKFVKVDLSREECSSLDRNRVYKERIVGRILEGYQKF